MLNHPFIDQSKDNLLADLLEVGPKKPLGYLPIFVIKDLCGVDYVQLVRYFQKEGLGTREYEEDFCDVGSGALYVYDPTSLKQLLNQNVDILKDAGWSTKVEEFVVRIATTTVKSPSSLFDLVADAFADYNNPLRKQYYGETLNKIMQEQRTDRSKIAVVKSIFNYLF